MLMCFFETGPSPLNQFFVFVSLVILFFSQFFFAESTSVGQHREAGKVIAETGGWLPDISRNWYVFCFGLGWEEWGVLDGGSR